MLLKTKDLQAIAALRKATVHYDECFIHEPSGAAIQVAVIARWYEDEVDIMAVYLDIKEGFIPLPDCMVSDKFRDYLECL
jgi:hypothetical protein